MICITWYEPTDYGFEEHHYVCDKLGAYEYDEVLFDIVNDYKKLGYKITGIVKGIVFYYGDTCDLNNLTSTKSIWEVSK